MNLSCNVEILGHQMSSRRGGQTPPRCLKAQGQKSLTIKILMRQSIFRWSHYESAKLREDVAVIRTQKKEEPRRFISRGLFPSRITKPRILCESQVRMGGKARQEMRGGGCKGGRTDERTSGTAEYSRAQMNRTDSPEYSTVYGDDKNYSAPRKNRISELSTFLLDTAVISRWVDKP